MSVPHQVLSPSETSSSQANNTNGIKTYEWGYVTWVIFRIVSESIRDKPLLGTLFFGSQPFILPCIHCRRSFGSFIRQPTLSLESFETSGDWPTFVHMIHNAVNIKLDKPLLSSRDFSAMLESDKARCLRKVSLNCTFESPCAKDEWSPEDCFWFWLETMAMDFPVRQHKDDTIHDHRRRLSAYVETIYSLCPILEHVGTRFCPRLSDSWKQAWKIYPLSGLDVASRTALLKWVFNMELAAGYRSTNNFATFMDSLHPIRASTCAPTADLSVAGQCL